MAPPAAKKQKVEEEVPVLAAADAEMPPAEAKVEETTPVVAAPKLPEPPKELEQDAPKAVGAKIKDSVAFLTPDTTLNVMSSTEGNMLMALSDGGIRHLLAGARASVGLKSGRYMFEAKVVEASSRAEDQGQKTRSVMKIGFSTSGSSLLMGDSETDICFDSEGGFVHNKKRTVAGARFTRDSVVAVVLNLDAKSENANTISLFKDGKRACLPQALPAGLVGKTLYPTVTYRNVSVHVNFGPAPIAPLPFICTMVSDTAAKDSAVTTVAAPKDGKYEVLFPVGLPDEGSFDWLDAFKAKNPDYTELSDRMILEWAEKSGFARHNLRTSIDKPEMNFGIKEMDDLSVQRMLQTITPLQERNFVVMEVRGNLIKEFRTQSLGRWGGSHKKVAQVILGDPTAEFKKLTSELILKSKQAQSDTEFRLKKVEETRKKLLEKRQKELEKAKVKAEKEKKRKFEEIKKTAEKAKVEADKKRKIAAGETVEEDAEEAKEDEPEEEEEEVDEPAEPEAKEEQPPKVVLTAEEKKMLFRKHAVPDLTLFTLNTSFTKFSVPEQDEGFDEIRTEWNKGAKAQEYLKQWILARKQTSRVEDIHPSAWFQSQLASWKKAYQQWQKKQSDFKAKLQKKASDKAAKAVKKAMAEKAAVMKAAAAAAKKAAAEKEGKEVEEEEPVPMEEEAEEEEEVEVDFEGVDIFGLDDVDDIGDGIPLQKDFASEDWTLISLWFELHLLAHAFKKDCNDEERLGVTLDHLAFYYSKYYRKNLDLKSFGVESFGDLVNLAKDAVLVNKDGVLESNLDEEMENSQVFVKMAEEARRFRTLEIDMGKEDVKLKFQTPQMQMPQIPISAVGNFPAMVANIAGGNAMVGKGTKGKGNGKGVFSQGFGGQDFGKGKGKGKWQQQQKGW